MSQYSDILERFSDYKIAYYKEKKCVVSGLDKNLLPELIIYNNDSVIALFHCSSDLVNFKAINQYESFDSDEEGYSKLYDTSQYFELLKEIIDKDKARIIMDLFFNINSKFNKFHFYWTSIVPQDCPRLLYCGILCNAKDKSLIDDSLKFLYSSFNFNKPYQLGIKKEDLEEHTIFLIDIATFYHLTNEGLFAVKKSFANRLVFRRGERHETIGKNDFNVQDDPNRNPLHPDALSEEQKIGVGKNGII